LITVGRLSGHRDASRPPTYIHPDDAALQGAAAQVAAVIVLAMGFLGRASDIVG